MEEYRLTLDLDACGRRRLLGRLALVRRLFPSNEIEVWRSAGGHGFHVCVYGVALSFRSRMLLRFMLGDDRRRIEADVQRHKSGLTTDLLFVSKHFGGTVRTATPVSPGGW